MTPEAAAALSALATWAGVVVSTLVGVGGLLLASHANNVAKGANRAAARANASAEEALRLSKESNKIAEDANDISTRSNAIAVEANDLSKTSHARAGERNDVDWTGEWDRPGTYRLRNDGQDPALTVRATVTVDGEAVTEERASVGNNDFIEFHFPAAVVALADENAQRAKANESAAAGPRLTLSVFVLDPLFGRDHSLSERITWETPLGSPKLHDEFWPMTSLEP